MTSVTDKTGKIDSMTQQNRRMPGYWAMEPFQKNAEMRREMSTQTQKGSPRERTSL